jgi:hypothetical protein
VGDATVTKKTRYLIETAGFYLVAGARNHHYLRSQGRNGVEAASLSRLALQIEMTAGVGKHLNLLFQTAD